MSNNENLQLFENQPIRTAWNEEEEEWYFSIVDVVGILSESPDPNNYWKVLKKRLKDEGNESVTNCNQLKLKSPKDGKRYKTDVANTEQLLRIIQSVPSKKAEPFKLWLAQVGRERIEETLDPELIADRIITAIFYHGNHTRKTLPRLPREFINIDEHKKTITAIGKKTLPRELPIELSDNSIQLSRQSRQ